MGEGRILGNKKNFGKVWVDSGRVSGVGSHLGFSKAERKRLAKKCKDMRRKHLLSQVDLAALMGVSAPTVCTLEKAVENVGVDTLRKLMDCEQTLDAKLRLKLRRVPA
jgi:DNA-binding XRE family transcriptional regulator